MFVVNEFGEPVEFCFNRGERGRSIFWRGAAARSHVVRLLFRSLTDACRARPDLLLARTGDLEDVSPSDIEYGPKFGVVNGDRISWPAHAPEEGSSARQLLDLLRERGFLCEPFSAPRPLCRGIQCRVTRPYTRRLGLARWRVAPTRRIEIDDPPPVGEATSAKFAKRLDEVGKFASVAPSRGPHSEAEPLAAVPQKRCKPKRARCSGWPSSLFPFQRARVAALIGTDRILLADDMGLGKTIQAIAAVRILTYRGEIRKALLVTGERHQPMEEARYASGHRSCA